MYEMFLWHQYLCPGNEKDARKNKSKNRIISNTGTWGGTVIESNNILFNLKIIKPHTFIQEVMLFKRQTTLFLSLFIALKLTYHYFL